MHDAGERHAGHVPGRGRAAAEVPALTGQRPGVLLRDGPDVEDVDDQQVAPLRTLDGSHARCHYPSRNLARIPAAFTRNTG